MASKALGLDSQYADGIGMGLLITALEKSTLHGYARILYHSSFIPVSLRFIYALTLYLGIINAVVTLCRYII